MNQTALELDTPPAEAVDRTGFDIGWDHAHHGLVPPAELLHAGTPVCQGWMAGRAVFGRRVLATQRATRQWLQLRLLAWRRGIAFEGQQLTPHYLVQIQATTCPVLRVPLGGTPADASAVVIERLNPRAGYAAGNVAVMSRQAVSARNGMDVLECVRCARRAELSGEPVAGLDAGAWWRLAALASFATPMPFHEAVRLPLAVLPPNRARLLNAVQGLQALVTLLFTAPGWSARTRSMAGLLPVHTLRHDFNLFVGALAPRVMEAGSDPLDVRRALEDAWLHERVQRRWQHFVFSLGEAGVEKLLEQAPAQGLVPARTLTHGAQQATDGWALTQGGRAPHVVVSRRLLPPRSAQALAIVRPAL